MTSTDTTTTYVIRNDDDSPVPTVGRVVGWEDEDRVLVAWADSAYAENPADEARVEYADELTTIRRQTTSTDTTAQANPLCDHCQQPVHHDSGGWWVGEDETAECPKDTDANAPGHEVNGSPR